MFTFNRVVQDVKNEAARRREIAIEIQNELGHTKQQMMSFSLNETAEAIKKAFASYIDEINVVPVAITDVTVTPIVPPEPTQAELDRTEWQSNWTKLKLVEELITAQVLTGNEPQVLALRKKVKDDFKVTYLG